MKPEIKREPYGDLKRKPQIQADPEPDDGTTL